MERDKKKRKKVKKKSEGRRERGKLDIFRQKRGGRREAEIRKDHRQQLMRPHGQRRLSRAARATVPPVLCAR